jgi:hypothetical protein
MAMSEKAPYTTISIRVSHQDPEMARRMAYTALGRMKFDGLSEEFNKIVGKE